MPYSEVKLIKFQSFISFRDMILQVASHAYENSYTTQTLSVWFTGSIRYERVKQRAVKTELMYIIIVIILSAIYCSTN